MSAKLTTDQVWQVIDKEVFAVIGMVTARQEARTVGVMYTVRDRKLYLGTESDTWKVRHIAGNPHVSVTIPIAKRIPILPWIRVPSATITFSGRARVLPATEAPTELLRAVFRGIADDVGALTELCLVEISPEKDFLTYGVGVTLMQMRHPEMARGRAPVA
jgi:nitroimidazol reductase NimA-like FMN-containing flavoprotein (pyridoxamine 5'-phosphate oxidase superfamily)